MQIIDLAKLFKILIFKNCRTTTPNSLREHLKETLTKNLEGSDIAETIQVIFFKSIKFLILKKGGGKLDRNTCREPET